MLDKDGNAGPGSPSRGTSRTRHKLSFAELLVELANAHEREVSELAEHSGSPSRPRTVYKGLSKHVQHPHDTKHEKGVVSKIISKEPVKKKPFLGGHKFSDTSDEDDIEIVQPRTRPQTPGVRTRPQTPEVRTRPTTPEIRTRPHTPSGLAPSWDAKSPSTQNPPTSNKDPPLPNVEPLVMQHPNAVPDDEGSVVQSKPGPIMTTVAEHVAHRLEGDHDDKFTPEEEEHRQRVVEHLKLREKATFAKRAAQTWEQISKKCTEPPRKGRLATMLSTTQFQMVASLVILVNAVSTSVGADIDMRSRGTEKDALVEMTEFVCLCFYTVELVLKGYVHRLFFFWNDETAWSLFDLILVAQGWFDTIMKWVSGSGGAKIAFARLARLLKLSKIFRIFRMVKFLRDLRTMLMSVVSSFVAMFWAFVLLATVLFMFALMFVQLQASFLTDLQDKGTLHEIPVEDIDMKFGSVGTGMLTLFQATTGGVDWIELWDVLIYEAGACQVALVLFIFFWHFSMLNVVTGIVMEKAVRNAQPDRDEMMMEQRKSEEETCRELYRLFKEMDTDNSNTITLIEFVECLKVEEIASYFATIGLSIQDAEYFFSCLSQVVGSDAVPVDQFIKHCSHMKGNAMAIDLVELAWEVQGIKRMISQATGIKQGSRIRLSMR